MAVGGGVAPRGRRRREAGRAAGGDGGGMSLRNSHGILGYHRENGKSRTRCGIIDKGAAGGGFFSERNAAAYPDAVERLYFDAPFLTFEDFTYGHDIGP